ncbi:hypothetical protein RB600_009689 [Gaeumannomyces tritici]
MGSELHARSPDELDYDGATPDTEVSTPVNPYGPGDVLGGTKDKKRLLAREKLVRLSLEEKVSLLTAADFWRTKVIPSKGIPSAKTSDGPNGARGGIFVGGTKAALFPCGISLAATWNKSLLRDISRHLASEAKARSANILLAPTVCLHRHPLGRRNFESFSEDPVLTGKLAAQYIGELQEKGVAATIIKHFVGNEKETNRLTIDSRISERPLQEIYLRPFEIAVREANPWAIMTSYNLVNETHADMHENVLKDILRGEWGYDGHYHLRLGVMTCRRSRRSVRKTGRLHVDGRLALDLWDWAEEGEAMFDGSIDYLVEVDMEAGKAVELRVEMTNELRPAAKQKEFNMTHKYGGCRIGFKEEDTVDYLQQAVDAARAADVAVIIVSLDAEWESEGYDRQTMDLPSDGSQDRLIEAVLDANPRTVVVDQSGSPVTMPWADRVPAILQAWHQGQEAGNALADVLFGRKCPSGKLPCTFPRRLQDTPAYHNWPGENLEVVYGEGVYVGYRHYERVRIAPLFPFGHGLSYTSFEYGRPSLSGRALSGPDDVLELVLGVSNVGTLAGAETVQVYVADERFAVGYYDTSVSRWVAGEGRFNVLTGASSADIRHQISFDVTQTFSWVF